MVAHQKYENVSKKEEEEGVQQVNILYKRNKKEEEEERRKKIHPSCERRFQIITLIKIILRILL